MTTNAQIGYGAELWIANSSATLTRIAELTAVTPPNPTTAEIEATHFASPNRRREYIAGLIEDGEGSFTINYVPGGTTAALIKEAQDSGSTRAYKIVLPNGAGTWEVTGFLIVRSFTREIPIADRMTATVGVRFTGAEAEAAGV